MNYKVGDVVRFHNLQWFEKNALKYAIGYIFDNNYCFTNKMFKFAGKEFEIHKIFKNYYTIKYKESEEYRISDWMIYKPEHREQKNPIKGKETILPLVIKDLTERADDGKQKYGTFLESFNKRNSLQDLYEELQDATMYCKQKIIEREELKKVLKDVIPEIEKTFDGSLVLSAENAKKLLWVYNNI